MVTAIKRAEESIPEYNNAQEGTLVVAFVFASCR
jgi:hypothetical protein